MCCKAIGMRASCRSLDSYESRTKGLSMDDMIRLSLNTPGITGTMVGMDSIEIVNRNLQIMRTL